MAKKFGKFLFLTAAATTAVAAYQYMKKKDQEVVPAEEEVPETLDAEVEEAECECDAECKCDTECECDAECDAEAEAPKAEPATRDYIALAKEASGKAFAKATVIASNVAVKMEETFNTISGKIGEMVENSKAATEAAEAAAAEAEEAATEVVEAAEEAVEEAVEATEEAVEETVEATEEAVEEVKEEIPAEDFLDDDDEFFTEEGSAEAPIKLEDAAEDL